MLLTKTDNQIGPPQLITGACVIEVTYDSSFQIKALELACLGYLVQILLVTLWLILATTAHT